MALAGPMKTLSRFTKPVVWLLTVAGDLLLRLLRVRASNEPAVTQAEIEVMIAQGAQLSLIHISEPTRPYYISYAVFCLKKLKML